jgi:hypothetical protein
MVLKRTKPRIRKLLVNSQKQLRTIIELGAVAFSPINIYMRSLLYKPRADCCRFTRFIHIITKKVRGTNGNRK